METEKTVSKENANNGKGHDNGGEEVGLKAKMSLLNGCTVIVGSIIGSGIFVSPTGVLRYTGSVNMALVVWIISGVFSMVSCRFFKSFLTMILKLTNQYGIALYIRLIPILFPNWTTPNFKFAENRIP